MVLCKDADNLKRRETNEGKGAIGGILPDEFCVRGVTGSRIFVFESRNRVDHARPISLAAIFKFHSFPVCIVSIVTSLGVKEKKKSVLLQERKIKGKEEKREIDSTKQ